ncbi:MAG: hypothetical protein LAQ69_33985 [Acidobacteriia bacterium]|nr:hypothetical protein [Terriglobia bacterium]
MNTRSLALLLALASSGKAQGAENVLACAPAKPVVTEGQAVEVKAWPPAGEWRVTWRADAGQVEARGKQAIWDLTDVASGRQIITAEAARDGAASLTCTAAVFVESRIASRGDRVTRKFLLVRGQKEPKSYGLYSYVLLTRDGGDPVAKERNRKALEIWFNKIPAISALERKESTAKLNITMVPVDSASGSQPALDWIVVHYDYNRADLLLAPLPGAHTHGPYLVSSLAPLSAGAGNRMLVLDASWAPSSTISFWMDEFLNQAAQARFDRPRTLDLFNLKLRSIIGVLAEGLPQAREALASTLLIGKEKDK